VAGVIAVATDLVIPEAPDSARFGLDQGEAVADFIEKYFHLESGGETK